MPLFDDISRKLTQAGQSIEQKTKDVASLTKISSALSGEEKNRERIYIQIGKLYFEQNAETAQGEFSSLVATAKQIEQRIVELRRQAQEIKGVRSCEQCGAEVSIDAAFCNHCGAPMPKLQIPVGAVVCTCCGAAMQPGVKFCTSCGNSIQGTVSTTPTEESSVPQQTLCTNCGAVLSNGVSFCTGCGTPIAKEQCEDVASFSKPMSSPGILQNSQSRTCQQCGAALVEGALFCTECGQRL